MTDKRQKMETDRDAAATDHPGQTKDKTETDRQRRSCHRPSWTDKGQKIETDRQRRSCHRPSRTDKQQKIETDRDAAVTEASREGRVGQLAPSISLPGCRGLPKFSPFSRQRSNPGLSSSWRQSL